MNILLVEDEAITALSIKAELKTYGYATETVSSGERAVSEARDHNYDLILMDIHLAGKLSGIDAMKKINDVSSVPVIFITGYTDEGIQREMADLNPLKVLNKPVSVFEIQKIVREKFV